MSCSKFLLTLGLGVVVLFPAVIEGAASTSRVAGLNSPLLQKLGSGNDKECFNLSPSACPPQNQNMVVGNPCTVLNDEEQVCDQNALWNQSCRYNKGFTCGFTPQPNNCPGRNLICETDPYSATGKSWGIDQQGGCGSQTTCY